MTDKVIILGAGASVDAGHLAGDENLWDHPADNGSNWYVSGAPDEHWDNDMLHLLDTLTGNDFEAVGTSVLMVDSDTGEVK